MSPLWMVLVLIGAEPESGQVGQDPASALSASPLPAEAARSGRELSEAVQGALRRWTRPSGEQAEQAAREFLILYRELGDDRELGVATRQQLRLKVRARLAQLAEQIAKRGKADPLETLVVPAEKQERLAQLGGQGRGQAAGGAGQARRGAGRQGAAAGRPARQGSSTQRFGPPDSGQELADLIQRTIAPSTWDVNGGPGTIRYWRPGPALVVRQTSDVHGDVSDFLNQLESMRR